MISFECTHRNKKGQTKQTEVLDSGWTHNVDLCSTDYLCFILVLLILQLKDITGNLLVATQTHNTFISIYYSQQIRIFPVF